jgi:RNA polymerase sigma-70 factor, ECF subfamily
MLPEVACSGPAAAGGRSRLRAPRIIRAAPARASPPRSIVAPTMSEGPDLAAADDHTLAVHITGARDRPEAARAAEAELCRRFTPRIRAYGLRHLRDEQAAADLVQRVLLLALEKLRAGKVRHPEQIASFILGSARMICHELRRGGGRTEPLDPETVAAQASAPPPEPLAAAALARCFEALAERERSILLFSFYQERSAAEIARLLALEVSNVRVIRHRAIGRLRTCMGLDAEAHP